MNQKSIKQLLTQNQQIEIKIISTTFNKKKLYVWGVAYLEPYFLLDFWWTKSND